MSDLKLTEIEGELEVKFWKLNSIYKVNEECRVQFNGFVSETGFLKAPNSPTIKRVIRIPWCSGNDVEVIEKCQIYIDKKIEE